MSTPRTAVAAMSMVEVMVACTVLVIGISAGMGAIGNSSISSLHRQNVDRALAAIQSEIEDFQAKDDQALQSLFASGDAIFFPVQGLDPGVDPDTGLQMSQPIKVQRIATSNGAVRLTSLRFLAAWREPTGPASVEQFFHFTERR